MFHRDMLQAGSQEVMVAGGYRNGHDCFFVHIMLDGHEDA